MDHSEEERQLAAQLREGSRSSFRMLYTKYAPVLFAFSRKYLQSDDESEEIVQEVFLRIWEKRENINPEKSFSSYVIQAAKHRIFNGFRKRVNEQAYLDFLIYADDSSKNFTEAELDYSEIKHKAETAVSAMPPKRREIFRLSREEGLKNKEIADRLNISVKTVENQMGQALKYLRDELRDYRLPVLFFLLSRFF